MRRTDGYLHCGYRYIFIPLEERRKGKDGRKQVYGREHILIAERVLGRPLNGHPVHHHDEDRANNKHSNLVICEDTAYHELLHMRMEALQMSGHPDYRKCQYCKRWDDRSNLYIKPKHVSRPGGSDIFHRVCRQRRVLELKTEKAKKQGWME